MHRVAEILQALGGSVTRAVWRLGFAARFFWLTLKHSGTAFRRFHLTIREIYFAGVMSLVIILVSGLFVGMVLALQGYETLQRFGASESLGVLVALSLKFRLLIEKFVPSVFDRFVGAPLVLLVVKLTSVVGPGMSWALLAPLMSVYQLVFTPVALFHVLPLSPFQ